MTERHLEGYLAMLTAERLRELMTYRPGDGDVHLSRHAQSRDALAGKHVAGCAECDRVLSDTIDRRLFRRTGASAGMAVDDRRMAKGMRSIT